MAVVQFPKIFCTFAERPVSDHELAVAQALYGLLNSYNRKDVTAVINYFAPDARIDSLVGGGVVTRDQYRGILEAHYPHITSVRMDQVSISLESPQQADTYGTFGVKLYDGRYIGNACLIRFAHIDEAWRITEICFLTREILPRLH